MTDLDDARSQTPTRTGSPAGIAATALALLDGGVSAAAGLLVAVLTAFVVTTTALRYLFGTGLAAGEDIGIWLHTALVFLGLPLAARGSLSMRLDVLTHRLGPGGQRAAGVLADMTMVVAALTLASGAASVAQLIGGTSPTLGLPEAWHYLPAIVGGILAVIEVALRSLVDGRSPTATAATLAGGVLLFAFTHHAPIFPVASPSLVAAAVAAFALAFGAPLVHALIAGLALAVPFGARLTEAALIQTTIAGIDKFLLLAIPFFLLAGVLMNLGGLADRLVRFASALVGHRRGGLAQTCLVTNLMFAGVSGSSIADAAFGAKVLAPALVADGVPPAKASAIVAATAVLPNIIPPSIALLLLASVTDLSVGALFTGGLVAGIGIALALALALDRDAAPTRRTAATAGERRRALTAALPALGLAAVVFLGIRLGLATPTEAASLAAAYALVLTLATSLFSGSGLRPIGAAFARAGRETAGVGLLVAASTPLTFLFAVDGLPQAIASLPASIGGGAPTVMLVSIVILTAVGAVLDIGPAILLFGPLLLPAATTAGIDEVAFGVLLVVNLMIGGLTPPVGVLVYVTAGIADQPAGKVFRAALPFVLVLTAALVIMALVVALTADR